MILNRFQTTLKFVVYLIQYKYLIFYHNSYLYCIIKNILWIFNNLVVIEYVFKYFNNKNIKLI